MTQVLWAALLLQQFFATNAQLGYRFALPDGFAPFPEAARGQRDVVGCWTEPMPASYSGALVLCVQRMRTRLGREPMKQSDLPPSSTLTTYKWKGFDINGMSMDTAEAGGQRVTVLVAQVPLRKEAIQIMLAGPRDQRTRIEAIMTSIIPSLEGETNWLTDEERSSRLGTGIGALLAIAILAVLARLWRNRRLAAAAAAAAAPTSRPMRGPPPRPTGR